MDRKEILQLIEDIKKLLVLNLVTQGVQSKDIADVMGVHKSTISRLAPSRKLRNNRKGADFSQPIVLKPLLKIGKKPNHWSNKWWVQWLVAFLLFGVAAQALGELIVIGITKGL